MVVNRLAQDCALEFDEFKHRIMNPCLTCLKLFKMAFLEDTNEAFDSICRIYEGQLSRWIELHTWFDQTGETIDYFISSTWVKFYYATRGPKFTQFENIAQIMAYLKRCVHTSIAQYMRKVPPPSLAIDELEEVIEDRSNPSSFLATQEVWTRICALLPDPKDQRLADYIFYKDLKPAEILLLESGTWQTTEKLYKDIWRIRKLLRTDLSIKHLLSVEAD
jgi:hypothetical protein